MLSIRYSDPPETDAEAKARKDSNGPEPKDNFDITNYVQKITWSGDSEQAARKVDFTIAYNTPANDKVFASLDLKVGGFIYLFYRETADEIEIFQGRIFFRKRASEGYSFDFTCFDDMIYLAKSNIRAIISGTIPAAQTIVREIERSGSSTPQISYYVTAPTVEKGAETVAKQIEEKSPEAPSGVLKKSDRTIITPNEEKQKVDVYKINLRKAHKLKTGMTYLDNHAYLSTGYQAGRWEGLIHFDTRTLEPKGGTITYTVLEW